jgi:hypothetical protein
MSLIRSNEKKDKLAHLRIGRTGITRCGKDIDYGKSIKGCKTCDKCLDASINDNGKVVWPY